MTGSEVYLLSAGGARALLPWAAAPAAAAGALRPRAGGVACPYAVGCYRGLSRAHPCVRSICRVDCVCGGELGRLG